MTHNTIIIIIIIFFFIIIFIEDLANLATLAMINNKSSYLFASYFPASLLIFIQSVSSPLLASYFYFFDRSIQPIAILNELADISSLNLKIKSSHAYTLTHLF